MILKSFWNNSFFIFQIIKFYTSFKSRFPISMKFVNFSPYGKHSCIKGPVVAIAIIVPTPTVPPSIKPYINKTASIKILIHLYSQLVLSFIIKGIISFGATPTLVAESIENPIAIIKHPNAIKNIFNN